MPPGWLRTYLAGVTEAGSGSRWLRPKGNLTRAEFFLLLALALLPLALVIVRISALPGMLGEILGDTVLPSIGHELNQVLSLDRIPAIDRGQVLYLLFLPTGAMLIALARLTFGLRVIGFRSILIAVGFQQSGIVASLLLIATVVATVIALRPVLRRFQLPYYARVSVIMSLAVVVLLLALLTAPWLRSEVLFGVGFFPVLVLGLMAEGIAKTLERDSWMNACWRTGMTIGIAFVLAGIAQVPMLREIAIHFPELVVTQIVAVVLISEFLDLRLFQDLDARLSGVAVPRLFSEWPGLRVAVVRNYRRNGVIGRMGEPSHQGYDRYAIRRIVAALRERGHTVRVLEGDIRLLSRLRDFIPPHPGTGAPGGLVFNLTHGIQGELPEVHVPAMLEMAGVAYTGATPRGRLIASDRVLIAAALRNARVEALDLRATRNASAPRGRIQVPVLGNDPPECLPLVDAGSGVRGLQCPAVVDEALAKRIRDVALAAFRACGWRDFALVTIRVAPSGRLRIIEVGDAGALAPGSAFVLAAEAAGISFGDLIERIIAAARDRYRVAALTTLEVVPSTDEARAVTRTAFGV